MKNKHVATIFAILFGWAGFHKFYLGKWVQGILYIILALMTFGILPGILGIIEGILYFINTKEWFDLKYNIEYLKNKKFMEGYNNN